MILNEHTVCNINVGGKTWKISTMRLDLTKYGGHLYGHSFRKDMMKYQKYVVLLSNEF